MTPIPECVKNWRKRERYGACVSVALGRQLPVAEGYGLAGRIRATVMDKKTDETSSRERRRRVQEIVERHAVPGRSVVDDFLAEKRHAAERENRAVDDAREARPPTESRTVAQVLEAMNASLDDDDRVLLAEPLPIERALLRARDIPLPEDEDASVGKPS